MNVAEILSVAAKSVRLAPGNPGSAVVGGLVGITQQLDIRVVAEGIETQDQARRLVAMGCKLDQGFAFSKAVDFRAASELLRLHGEASGASPLVSTDNRGAAPGRRSA